ncbi:uncharacterized protein LOC130444212 isoform X2 [Diorhabda sublineata]|uniref:uncharacterized protein LOC130444212 isoform X2 n=1 Tax=Diorhabda sublineata TaxID=1163346 RepID=UPI0024E1100A|nr:uncharacterized protein LOC130444212 isoform X2 [Diorhabda sublineata]
MERKISLQDLAKEVEDRRALFHMRSRSLSEGETRKLNKDDSKFEVFPSLPNSVLDTLGLRGDEPKEHMNQQEIEQKFASLALALSIDATTIKDRCKRQKRYRNQTEANLNMEINKLREKVTLMQPFCTDYEKAELFSTIMTQIDIIMNAVSLVSMSAERFGSVQQEERLTESASLMVTYVQSLKQQRDAAKKQLHYTKRVLQNSADSPGVLSPSPTNNHQSLSPNVKLVSKRRASIATFSQPVNDAVNQNRSEMEIKKVTRRTSDLSLMSGSLIRRPTRLELGRELKKIKENHAEVSNENDLSSDIENDEEYLSSPKISTTEEELVKEIDMSTFSFREKVIYKLTSLKDSVTDRFNYLTRGRNFHDFYMFCALVCFSIGLLSLLDIFTEYEYAKRGLLSWLIDDN